MNENLFLTLCGVALPFLSTNFQLNAQQNKEQPNILCVVCEDISPYLGCYGDPVAVTPNLDNFSKESIRYTGMYTTMGVSAPSRAALITGMYPTSIGANHMRTSQKKSKPEGITPYDVVLPDGVKCYTEFLRSAGYYCTNNAKTDYQFESPLTAWDENGTNAHWKNAPNEKPFFSIFNLDVTHEFKIMDRASLPLRVNPQDIILPPYFPDDPIVRKDMAIMYNNITEMDKQFQQLIDDLKKNNRYDNTIIIWYSDNGGPLPRQKREIYESGTLVPFMIRFPDGYKAGTTDSDLHSFVDIPATILSLANVKIPDYMHGKAFLGTQKSKKRQFVYGARDRIDTFYDKQASVRDNRFRLIQNFKREQSGYVPIISRGRMPIIQKMVELHEKGELNSVQEQWFSAPRPKFELYDLKNDPHEINNLAENPKYKDKIKVLTAELDNWIKTYNPEWHLSETELIEKFWHNRVQPQVEQPTISISDGKATLSCATAGASIAYQINGKGLSKNHWFLYSQPFAVSEKDKISVVGVKAGYKNSSMWVEAAELLTTWVDTLLDEYQITHSHSSLNGGLLCPACGRIHGRCGDAVYPIMFLAHQTGETKYLESAKQLMKWMDNVRLYDGSWMNDIHVSDWNGTTVFMAISLAETLNEFGYLLDDSTRNNWKRQLEKAGEFIYSNDFIFSRKRENMRNMNVNYSASGIYALYLIGKMFDRNGFIEKAAEIAADLEPFFTENNHFLFGEGPEIKMKTKNGCLPVDLLYNVEESLPNMAMYAQLTNNKKLEELVTSSVLTHLEFMLPDGAWDNSWGTRSFKWTYWGGRTSDGFMAGFYTLAHKNPILLTAIARNLELLRQSTKNGLLQGGIHYESSGNPSCIHHTFGHAKVLASFLSKMEKEPLKFSDYSLPREKAYGVKFFKDIRTWLVAKDDWRATVTGYDSEYKVKGTHPMGGVLSLLWHDKSGPLFAAGMNDYTLIEAPNMQMDYQQYKMAATPRIEFIQNGTVFSNLDDLNTEIKCDSADNKITFEIETHLVDKNQKLPEFGLQKIDIRYIFDKNKLKIDVKVPQSLKNYPVNLVLPLIADKNEDTFFVAENHFVLKKKNAKINIISSNSLQIANTNDGRIFNFVPGFLFVPIQCAADKNGEIAIEMSVE